MAKGLVSLAKNIARGPRVGWWAAWVLWGAAGLTRRWRPVIATEPRIERDSQRLFEHHLAPLGYGYRGTCDGLNFYVP